MSNRRTELLVYVLLAAVVLAVFGQMLDHGFINYDDNDYVTANPHVRTGLTIPNLAWAATATYECNWHPLTWASHMLDYTLYGPNPGMHHLTSILIHLLNTLILFAVLRRATKSTWRSALVAALFAVHPLHVESVAWIAERKDLLCGLFWTLTMWAYVRYSERPSIRRYAPVLVFFVLGLMSKPMIVTLPVVLILLDYWPLNRPGAKPGFLILEKAPLFVLAGASSVITYIAQNSGLAVGSLDQFPLGVRVANAAVAYMDYIGKMLVPVRLAVFYPHPGTTLPVWQVVGSALLLVLVTATAIRLRKRRYLLVGWLWHLVTLTPVIGLVQVGWQAMADRYTYMPLIGLFVLIAWSIPEAKGLRPVAPMVIIAALAWTAHSQVHYWRDSDTLFAHALSVTRDNPVAENNLGIALAEQGKLNDAIAHHLRAARLKPGWADARYSLGTALLQAERVDNAIPELSEAIRINPNHTQAHNNLGAAFLMQNKTDEAIRQFNKALLIDPENANARRNLETALSGK